MEELLIAFLKILNEILASAIVIIAASLLLYNLSRNLTNRVARTSGIVLACVTFAYICDVFLSLEPSLPTYQSVLRLQWVGIAFLPAAMFHLSDALLATTGLPSRGRRRRVYRILYLISSSFLVLASFSNALVFPIVQDNQASMKAGPIFPLYFLFFALANIVAFVNVERARRRCLTRRTQRRMGYLLVALLTAPMGIFPYSVLLPTGDEFSLLGFGLVNASNVIIILMLIFLSYPLSFFGSRQPDRVLKAELLRFLLHGPGTGMLSLVVIIFTTQATRILGLPGETFMPFAVVAAVLLWQWWIALSLPWLERRLIYTGDAEEQITRLQTLSDRLLTQSDLDQLLEATLASCCDYLRANYAFVASLAESEPEIIKVIGQPTVQSDDLNAAQDEIMPLLEESAREDSSVRRWEEYWITPLYSKRTNGSTSRHIIGFMGIEAGMEDIQEEQKRVLGSFVRRTAQALDDILLQNEIFAALEGLLPQISLSSTRTQDIEYRPGRTRAPSAIFPNPEDVIEQVRAALRHYWGGPGISRSRLMELAVVQQALAENENNPVNALRSVLLKALERQRPEGERKMTNPEWTVYNILQLRFIENKKVRDVAYQMGRSEADLYRKQRAAIESLAYSLMEMEEEIIQTEQ